MSSIQKGDLGEDLDVTCVELITVSRTSGLKM